MALSRLRMRLAGRFALSFLLGLTLLNAALFAYLRHRADERLRAQLQAAARDLVAAVRDEYSEDEPHDLTSAAVAALKEYPPRADAFVIVDAAGRQLAARGPASVLAKAAPLPPLDRAGVMDRETGEGNTLRVVIEPSAAEPAFAVLSLESTTGLAVESAAIGGWLLASMPIVALIGLGVGYVLARGALQPIADLGTAVAGIAPESLGQRLPVQAPLDEVDRLTEQFNGLLDRLEAGRLRNQTFISRTAHQIRTPLTLLLGEATLALESSASPDARHHALRRMKLAAEQMRHRVEELQLLAQAEAGERPPLADAVELDGLMLECADLMRSRATATGRTMELCEVEPLVTLGSESLLREAMVELVENACRHASTARPIRLSCVQQDGQAVLSVTSAGPDVVQRVERAAPDGEGSGIGLTVVRWIAHSHSGAFTCAHEQGDNRFVLTLPIAKDL